MKKKILFGQGLATWFGLCLAFGTMLGLGSCKENIDESNYVIKTEQTVTDYLETTPNFSDIKSIFDRVALGEVSKGASSITSVLSARGNYTVFAPNNDAISSYLATLGVASVADLTYDQAQLIAYSCVIDNGDEAAYETPDFPSPGTFSLPNLNDRLLTCEEDSITEKFVINSSSQIVNADISLSNGVVHEVDAVIAPSSLFLPDMIEDAENMRIMSYLLKLTGWDKKMVDERDIDYEGVQRAETFVLNGVAGTFKIPTRRYLGFTGFVEPDEVYNQTWGTNVTKNKEMSEADWAAVLNIIKPKCQEVYGTEDADDYTKETNAVNRFVAYHFMEGKVAYDRFVHHYNEFGYKYGDNKNPQTKQLSVNVWDYYTTIGTYRNLIKVTQLGEQDPEHSLYLNRISTYDNGRDGTYAETSAPVEGILVKSNNGEYDNNAKNGFYYPINKILLCDQTTRDLLGNERIRIDMTTMLPEIASNNNRGNDYTNFPKGYFTNILNESSDTKTLYLMDAWSPGGGSWRDYQGDEFMFSGMYDFILRLPPVPKTATYELRIGVSMNPLRGMAQFYFGEDVNRLQPAGLPYDMRQSVSNNPAIPWVADTGDEMTDAENDKNMRNQGYLKGPNYFCITNGQGDQPARAFGGVYACVRRIIIAQQMDQNKTYYLRVKSALKKLDSQLFLDYFEFVPTNIYNGATPEDIW